MLASLCWGAPLNTLAIDLGNSSAKFGLFAGDELADTAVAPLREQGPSLGAGFVELVRHLVPTAVMSSVNPPSEAAVERAVQRLGVRRLLRLRRDLPVPMHCVCDAPEQVGEDRLANAVAAYRLVGGPAVVVDTGTAITLDAVSASGDFLGGAIAPGVGSSARALHEFTAQLPLVEPHSPGSVIGRNTLDAINIGIVIGLAGLVDRLIEGITAELGAGATVIATGGYAPLLAPHARAIDRVEQHLTLLGLKFIYEASLR
jgi:type III pantothenate kinase